MDNIKLIIKTRTQKIEKSVPWQKALSFTDIPESLNIDVIIYEAPDIIKDIYKVIIPKGYKKANIPIINISGKWRLKQTDNENNNLHELKIIPYISKYKYVNSTHRIDFIDKNGKKTISGFLTVCFNIDKTPFLTLWFRPYEEDRKNPVKILSRYLINVCDTALDIVYFLPLQLNSYTPVYNNDELAFWLIRVLEVKKAYRDTIYRGNECEVKEFIKKNQPSIEGNIQQRSGVQEIDTVFFMPKMIRNAGHPVPTEVTLRRYTVLADINRYTFKRL
jgi:hypothetical protein